MAAGGNSGRAKIMWKCEYQLQTARSRWCHECFPSNLDGRLLLQWILRKCMFAWKFTTWDEISELTKNAGSVVCVDQQHYANTLHTVVAVSTLLPNTRGLWLECRSNSLTPGLGERAQNVKKRVFERSQLTPESPGYTDHTSLVYNI